MKLVYNRVTSNEAIVSKLWSILSSESLKCSIHWRGLSEDQKVLMGDMFSVNLLNRMI